jgi:hypothetical protein
MRTGTLKRKLISFFYSIQFAWPAYFATPIRSIDIVSANTKNPGSQDRFGPGIRGFL